MTKIWQTIVVFMERFGQVLSRTILTFLYFLLIGPVGIFFGLFSDRLGIRHSRNTNWHAASSKNKTLYDARRQS